MPLGLDGVDESVAPATGAATISAATSETYTWATACRRVAIHNHPDSPARLYVQINASADASLLNWDVVLEAGDRFSSQPGLRVLTVRIYADVEVDKNTEFSIRGWE